MIDPNALRMSTLNHNRLGLPPLIILTFLFSSTVFRRYREQQGADLPSHSGPISSTAVDLSVAYAPTGAQTTNVQDQGNPNFEAV